MWFFLSFLVVFLFLTSLVLFCIGLYNQLVGRKNEVGNAFSSIDVLLKKRCDLVPNLVATAKQFLQFEQKTLVDVTRLRSQVVSARNEDTSTRLGLENELSRALGNIVVAIENYPELQGNQNMLQLQSSLIDIEEQISAARRFYNRAVTEYNNAIEMFPGNLIAQQMRYRRKEVWEADEADRRNVDVQELFNRG